MADRKHSPDVLAELLGAELPPAPAPDLKPIIPTQPAPVKRAPRSQVQRTEAAVQPPPITAAEPAAQVAPPAWETEIVTFQFHRGWRPRYVSGAELKDWLTGPLIHDYIGQRGAEGWELAGASSMDRFYGVGDNLQLYFKRPK